MDEAGNIDVTVEEVYAKLDPLGRALFESAQKDVVIEKLQAANGELRKALAEASNAHNERPVKAA